MINWGLSVTSELLCKYTEITCDNVKPCPFCGSHAYLNDYEQPEGYHRKVVICGSMTLQCPMEMPTNGFYRATKREALEIWNTRPLAKNKSDILCAV